MTVFPDQGGSLSQAARSDAQLPASLPQAGEELTFVFTDIAGSTRLLDEIGPDRYHTVSDAHRRVVRDVISEFDGIEVDTAGDAFFIVFANATKALAAVSTIQRRFYDHLEPGMSRLRVRMGINSGSAVRSNDGLVGLDVHRAARISAVTNGGQVVVSEGIVRAVEADGDSQFEFLDLGRHRLKDLSEPTHLFQLVIEGVDTDFPALKTLEAFPTNLPVQLTPFIGRQHEVQEVSFLITDNRTRLATLIGPGGVGKTRLALQAAAEVVDRFSDGVFFVSLAALRSESQVLPAIAQALGVNENVPGLLIHLIPDYISDREILLVLDNLEHLPLAIPDIAALINASPSLTVLATSRGRLGIEDEHEYLVGPLAVADVNDLPQVQELLAYDSIALFVERARVVKPRFELTANNASAIAGICARLDGIPLAIELAAARIKLFSASALHDRLSERLVLLTSKAHDLPQRHQTLQTAIDWSVSLLSQDDRELFTRVGVFVGGFTLEASEAVCNPEGTLKPQQQLGALVEANLIQSDQHASSAARFSLLETIRDFASERLNTTDIAPLILEHHADYYLALLTQAAPHLRANLAQDWMNTLKPERANIGRALRWLLDNQRANKALRLGADAWLFWFFSDRRLGADALARIMALVQSSDSEVDEQVLMEFLSGVATLYTVGGDLVEGERFALKLLGLSRKHGFDRGQAWALTAMATIKRKQGDFVDAADLFRRAAGFARSSHNALVICWTLIELAGVCVMQAKYDEAISVLEEALGFATRWEAEGGGVRYLMRIATVTLAGLNLLTGNRPQACDYALQGLRLAYELKDNLVHLVAGLETLAAAIVEEDPHRAIILQAHADAISDRERISHDGADNRIRDETMNQLHMFFSDAEFTNAWERATHLSLAEVVDIAGQRDGLPLA